MSRKIKPHAFAVFEGDDAYDPTTWCRFCNCVRRDPSAPHVEWGVDEDSGEYFVENMHGVRVAEGLTFAQAIAWTQQE